MVQGNPLVVHKASLEETLGSLLQLVAGSSTSCTTLIMYSLMRTVTVIICLLVMYHGSKSLSACSGLLACLLTAGYNPVFFNRIPTLCSNFHRLNKCGVSLAWKLTGKLALVCCLCRMFTTIVRRLRIMKGVDIGEQFCSFCCHLPGHNSVLV